MSCKNINSHNNRHWHLENFHTVYEIPVHDLKSPNLMCRVCSHNHRACLFFKNKTINSDHNCQLILTPFFRKLT